MSIKSASLVRRRLGAAASLPAVATACIAPAQAPAEAQQATFADFPYVIFCEHQGITR